MEEGVHQKEERHRFLRRRPNSWSLKPRNVAGFSKPNKDFKRKANNTGSTSKGIDNRVVIHVGLISKTNKESWKVRKGKESKREQSGVESG